MSSSVKKAVILTAGLGTRFLPMTKVIPKAMLPILNKPVIQYLVEEAIASGITEIMFVNGRGHRAIEDHFSHSFELAHDLNRLGKTELLKELEAIEGMARFSYTIQDEPKGDGHALLCAREWIGDEPFAVLFGDDIVDGPVPALKQLINVFEEKRSPILSVQPVAPELIHSYGVIGFNNKEANVFNVNALQEKPAAAEAISGFGIIGKYVFTPKVLAAIESATPSRDGELRVIDGLIHLLEHDHPIFAVEIEGKRYDTGTQKGLLEANIGFARKDPELSQLLG